ncbi:hypothetical protein BDQ12DRAFT_760118, partial [Crucibulum laeve]
MFLEYSGHLGAHTLEAGQRWGQRHQKAISSLPRPVAAVSMAVIIPRITVAQAATIFNALITFVQYTLGLALVALFIYILPNVNSANSWSVFTRGVHSSLWPSLLRSDSVVSSNASTRVNIFSKLSVLSTILIIVAGIVTPLGLKDGPVLYTFYSDVDASFVQDTSPLGLATSPRMDYTYDRICGAFGPVTCPGNGDNGNTSVIAPSIREIFSSTPYGPFSIEFRRFYKGSAGYNYTVTEGQVGTVESLVLRNGIFAVDGLIIDLSDTPGIGFQNHTIPNLDHGAIWSQDMLWLEPFTSCVNTNLTIDYMIPQWGPTFEPSTVNLTDAGGFVNLTTEYPPLSRDGQHIDLHQHAYKGAVLSNLYSMRSFNNMSRNESFMGRAFPLRTNSDITIQLGRMNTMDLKFLRNASVEDATLDVTCQGMSKWDTANITNVGVQCGMFLGPAERTDGGDPRIPSINSTWRQNIHVCSSTTRASIQRVEFSLNSTSRSLNDLNITRRRIETPILWAVEKTGLNITDVDLFWGPVADKYESDPSLSTIRSDVFYLPAGAGDLWGLASAGNPLSVVGASWNMLYSTLPPLGTLDYSGENNYALLSKWRSLIAKDPELGHAQIRNLIWTDIAANNLVGSRSNSTLYVSKAQPSVSYDLRFAIPLLLLLILWLPSFVAALFVLIFGLLKISYIRRVLNHTSVGRVVLGHSALSPMAAAP